jgi:hypothetical protein
MPAFNAGPIGYTVPRAAGNMIALNGGETYVLGPEAGWYAVQLSKYHTIQCYDPITTTWRAVGSSNEGSYIETVWSDGINYRVANQSGCVIGAFLTNNGSGYTSAPTVTASAGSSKWLAVVGGAISTTVTITNGGVGYSYPPTVIFSAPPPGGIQATGYVSIAQLSGGVVSGVTVVDQGAGYLTPPTVTFQNDPRELQSPNISDGYGAAAVTALTGAGTITALQLIDHGVAQLTMSSIPTLSITGGGGTSAAATAIVNIAVNALPTLSNAGATLPGSWAQITAFDAFPTGSPTISNPSMYGNLIFSRPCQIKEAISAGALTNTGSVILDGGLYTGLPLPFVTVQASQTAITTSPVVTLAAGAVVGTSFVMPV